MKLGCLTGKCTVLALHLKTLRGYMGVMAWDYVEEESRRTFSDGPDQSVWEAQSPPSHMEVSSPDSVKARAYWYNSWGPKA